MTDRNKLDRNKSNAMTLGRAIFVLMLTILMCCISGSIALRKLADADPADIYRSDPSNHDC